jgi:hypothetical protein
MQMTDRTYMLTVDLLDPTLDLDALKEFIKTTPLFDNWWNHIPGVFLVVSSDSASTISENVRKYTHEARLLVIEVNTLESDGWLTEKGWKWIRRRSGQKAEEPAEA